MALPLCLDRARGAMIAASLSLEAAAIRLWDALVVGAGPAGALVAHELARLGASVLLVDRSEFPRWKVCGGCLNARALAMLNRSGLASLTDQCHAVPLARVHLAARRSEASLPLPGGVAVSREAFDATLVRSAIAAGAAFLPGTYATLDGGNEDLRTVFLRQGARELTAAARLLIAADGLAGRLLLGERSIRIISLWSSRVGAGTIATDGPAFYKPGTIFMACGEGGYVGLVRLEDGRLDVAAAFDRSAVRHAGSPALAAAVVLEQVGWPALPLSQPLAWRGTPALNRRASRLAAYRLFVVGDSAGYIEPFTGEGMAWALESAVAVAPLALEAARQWSPRLAWKWSSLYRQAIGGRRACRLAARLLRHPLMTQGMIGLLRHFPGLGDPVLRHLNREPSKKAAHS
jgi:2-polyprenyl-6-methoxyphenol hydroxylase-like FAD-dependent oxidoreductase